AYTALSPRHAQVAWIRFRDNKERLQVWDFRRNKLILDRDITLAGKDLDYAGLAWSDDAANLVAVISDKRVHVFDLEGKLVEKTRVTDGKYGWEFPSKQPWRGSGPIRTGVFARIGKSRIRIVSELNKRELERRERGPSRPSAPSRVPTPTSR